jgi:hypothetical protein
MGFSPAQCGLVGVGLAVAYFLANAVAGAAQLLECRTIALQRQRHGLGDLLGQGARLPGRGHQRIAIALLPKFEQPGDGGDGKRGAEGQAEQAQLPGDRLVAAGWRGHRCQSRATRKAESGAGRLADGWQLEG